MTTVLEPSLETSLTPGAVAGARAAQGEWRTTLMKERLQIVRNLRALIARDGAELATAASEARQRPMGETLTAEVIPLAAAAAFLEKKAEQILRTRKVEARGRPVWLSGVYSEVLREPFGVVLIVGPANYPLFLPGVQALQALVAGNAVLVKPGRQGAAAMQKLRTLCEEAGLPEMLLQILPARTGEVHAALEAGVDLVVFTGSAEAGRVVLAAAAERTVPVIAELSGEDPMLVREDADVELVTRALRFGVELNGGDSCIAPRRVAATPALASELRARFPEVEIREMRGDGGLVKMAKDSAFALGASIFTRDEAAGRRLAEQITAGVVTINDCIMPTADSRLPFGGTGASGFGTTRGPEGLLAMTRPKVITIQRGQRRHLQPSRAGQEEFFLAYLQAAHGRGWRHRWQWSRRLLQLARNLSKS